MTRPSRAERAAEPLEVYLAVTTASRLTEYWLWSEARFTLHEPGDGRLVIQRRDRRENAAVYSSVGWHRYQWVLARASEVRDARADSRLPERF